MERFPEKLKNARKAKGLSQTELADQVCLTSKSINNYERGYMKPRVGTVYLLAHVLEVSVKYLTDDNCDDPLEDIEQDSIILDVKDTYGLKGAKAIKKMMQQSVALFAGGDISEDEKEVYFQALMQAYLNNKKKAQKKFGKKEGK